MIPLGPAITGAALWVLTRSPPSIQQVIARALHHLPLGITQAALVTAVKWLLGIGLIRYTSSVLSEIALNNWRVLSDANNWRWSDEVAVVTGACSGIGEEIAKALIKRGVKVVALDMADLPDRLQDGKCSRSSR